MSTSGMPLKKAAGQVANAVDSGGSVHNILCGTDGSLAVTPAAGGATSAKQDTQITAEQAILAKLPTVGTAGTASSNVLTVQGIASGVGMPPALGAAAGVSIVSSTAYEASHVLKASAGTLVSLVGYNSKASAQFIQLYNSASVPADTAVPIYTFIVPAASNFSLDVPVTGIPFTTGIVVANSSTGPTKTAGSSDCWFAAVLK